MNKKKPFKFRLQALFRRALRKNPALVRGASSRNPALVQIVGICPIAAASGDLKTALLLSAAFSGLLLLTQTLACLYMRNLPRFLRVSLYLIIGVSVLCPLLFLLDRRNSPLFAGAQLYFPLLAVSSVTALHCEKVAVNSPLKHTVYDSIGAAMGYSAVFLLVGFLRELLGSGTVWGRNIHLPITFPALLLPFGSFLLLAFLAAGLQMFVKAFFPACEEDTRMKISNTPVPVRRPAPVDTSQDFPQNADSVPPSKASALPQAVAAQNPIGARSAASEENVDLLEIQKHFLSFIEEIEQHNNPSQRTLSPPDFFANTEGAAEPPAKSEEHPQP